MAYEVVGARWLPLVSCVILTAVLSQLPQFKPEKDPDPPTKPMLALELPNKGEVARLLSSNEAVETATANTDWDRWFIAGYTILFLSFAFVHAPKLRAVMIVVALATAAFDVWENTFIRKFIAHPQQAVDRDIWLAAQLKWFGFFLAVLLVALLFARVGRAWWIAVVVVAVPGIVGMVAALTGNRVLIEQATGAAIVAILLSAVLLPVAFRAHPQAVNP